MGKIGPVPSASTPSNKVRLPGTPGCGEKSLILSLSSLCLEQPNPADSVSSERFFARNAIRLR